MNFDFSPEQKQLKESVRRFFGRASAETAVRRILESEDTFDKAIWNGLRDLGLMGAAIPEDCGGLGLGYLELCVIAEELGRSLAPVPFSSSIFLFGELIKLAGSRDQQIRYLPAIAAGRVIGTAAITDCTSPVEERPISCAVRAGRLWGTKGPVPDGMAADIAAVLAHDEEGRPDSPRSFFVVDLNGTGVARRNVPTIDPTRKFAIIVFDGAPVEAVGPPGNGEDILDALLDRVAVLAAFEQVGGAERALEMARDYALQRVAFGRKIGSFQALKHKFADMYVALTLARANAYYAAWALSTGAPQLPGAAATARISATESFRLCATENIHVHGGIGFTWAADAHLFYRRAHALALALGPMSAWEQKLIERLGDEPVT